MATERTIARNPKDPEGLDFETLRREGLALLQELSGKVWTDFNPHDPGVTILEQLCYALVDLAYRARFSVEDLLCSPEGRVEFQRQALHSPERILPSGPVTVADFGKLAFSENPEIEDIDLRPAAAGLQDAWVRVDHSGDIHRSLREMFAEHRMLGEDFDRIVVVRPKPCHLAGTVRIQGGRSRDEIFADIHFRCARRIASDICVRRFGEAIHSGMSLESIFTGVLTRQGVMDDSGFASRRRPPTMAEIVGLVRGVEGVETVSDLVLVDGVGSPIQSLEGEDYELVFPTESSPSVLRLVPERMLSIGAFLQDARRHLERFEFEYRVQRQASDLQGALPPLPVGRYRNPARYLSVQEDFPPTYGIGRAGLPSDVPELRKAAAKQLRAYLYPFEQMMADHLQLLESIPRLFSIDSTLARTYFPADLDGTAVPGLDEVRAPDGRAAAAAIRNGYDDHRERRGRILDLMLAMHGESFPDALLRRFNPCHAHDLEAWIASNKIRYLANLVAITARRMQPRFWRLRLSILLGLEHLEDDRKLSGPNPRSRRVVPHAEYLKRKTTHAIPSGDDSMALRPPPPQAWSPMDPAPAWIPCISERMLASGADGRCFRAVQREGRTFLVFDEPGGRTSYVLASCRDLDAAGEAAGELRDWIAHANRDAEGFHVVEHVRLRPRGTPLAGTDERWDWFGLRITVVFPGWPARFANDEFRQQAEDLVSSRTPAHVHPSFLWLSMDQMRAFEILRKRWSSSLERFEADPQSDTAKLDQRADHLVQFLRRASQAYPARVWY